MTMTDLLSLIEDIWYDLKGGFLKLKTNIGIFTREGKAFSLKLVRSTSSKNIFFALLLFPFL